MTKSQPKIFNTTGVCRPAKHYMLPVLPRIPDIADMIEGEYYFIIHAPRQSGKTTFLKTLTNKINLEGLYYALYCSLEVSQDVTDVGTAMSYIVDEINESLQQSPIKSLKQLALPGVPLSDLGASVKVRKMLNYLSVSLDKELAVFFDEADCLSGAGPLITFLRQIRLGYNNRGDSEDSKFPRSIALVGMRDIRDYLVQVRPEVESRALASPFNIKKKSLTLANFTPKEIKTLYSQHTDATGQIFTDEAIERAWHWTEGQPWLVNALANEVVVEQLKNDYAKVINDSNIDKAAHSLILTNDTHFDSLKERLKEPRVKRVIEAVIIGVAKIPQGIYDDDMLYTLDLGLLKKDPNNSNSYLSANPIYQEIIVRALTSNIPIFIDNDILDSQRNKWMDGVNLDINGLLQAFQTYWSENSEMYIKNNMVDSFITNSINTALEKYSLSNKTDIAEDIINTIKNDLINLTNEALTHLVLFTFLQRVLNGDVDFLQREYALGSQRADICVSYKGRRYPMELKINTSIEGPKKFEKSLAQLYGYINKSRASEGWLIIFDKDCEKPWDQKLTWQTQEFKGKTIHVVGC